MSELDWSPGDIYFSNNGRGPVKARILCVANGWVEMERGEKRKVRFRLREKFFLSPACGWARKETQP